MKKKCGHTLMSGLFKWKTSNSSTKKTHLHYNFKCMEGERTNRKMITKRLSYYATRSV